MVDNDKIIERKILTRIKKEQEDEHATFHERISDAVANFGGSWMFILLFSVFFGGWIVFNLCVYQFDVYPFILLNLILSCLAVFQAPFILMSQNRIREIDRKREERAYITNLKSELEIQQLEDKMDVLLIELQKKSLFKRMKDKLHG